MHKFLITGGAGFIGSSIAEFLSQKGHFVRILDNFSTGKEENLSFAKNLANFEVIHGDITSQEDCYQACRDIDYVLHHAALLSVPKSMQDPLSYNHVNIDGTLFMLQASAAHKIKRFVLASSAAIYGNTDHFPLQEDQLPMVISPYALSKLTGEHYCRIFSESFGLDTVCLRYFNVFGPKQALDDDYSSVIPKFINCLLNNEPTPIFGTGEQSRDFIFIRNIVEANFLAATTPGIKHEVCNVANGEVITVLELAKLLNKLLNKNIEPKFLPHRTGDIFKIDADISRITKILNYRPISNFEDGLLKTIEYFQTQGDYVCR